MDMTYILMGILVLCLAALALRGLTYDPEKKEIMGVRDTEVLRGLWCIIILLVHVPAPYQNRIQDALGSFAYIGVTFFFLTSGYGLQYSVSHKPGYLDCFWQRRLPILLIPALLANAFRTAADFLDGKPVTVYSFFNIDNWVKTLLLLYFFYWLIRRFMPDKAGIRQELLLCLPAAAYSLADRMAGPRITWGWGIEALGFAYGILLARAMPFLMKRKRNRWPAECTVLLVLSLVLGAGYLKYKYIPFWGDYLLKVILGIALTALVLHLTARFTPGNPVSRFLGNISYEFYLLHRGVFVLLHAFFGEELLSGICIWAAIGLTILLAVILKRLTRFCLDHIGRKDHASAK